MNGPLSDLSLTFLIVALILVFFYAVNRFWAFPRVAQVTSGRQLLPLLTILNNVIAVLAVALLGLTALVVAIGG